MTAVLGEFTHGDAIAMVRVSMFGEGLVSQKNPFLLSLLTFGVCVAAGCSWQRSQFVDERQHRRQHKRQQEDIIMPLSTHRAREIIRALQELERSIQLLCEEVEWSLVRNERQFFFHIGQVVRITCPLMFDAHWQGNRDDPHSTVRAINFEDGTIRLWIYMINDLEVCYDVSVHAVEEIEYDLTGDGAYLSDWDSDDN